MSQAVVVGPGVKLPKEFRHFCLNPTFTLRHVARLESDIVLQKQEISGLKQKVMMMQMQLSEAEKEVMEQLDSSKGLRQEIKSYQVGDAPEV